MNKLSQRALACLCAVSLLLSFTAVAGELEVQGRAVLEQHKNAVVTVQLVVKQKISMMGMGSQEEESKIETTGTVIAPDGLTVIALSAMDPSSVLQQMMGGMGEQLQIDAETSDVKLLLADGSEVPAKVVLRDRDLDLAFLRPREKPAQDMAFIDLSNAGQPAVLDRVLAINRFGTVANRAYGAAFEDIAAVVEKPRLFYVPTATPTHTEEGCPAFTLDGKAVGIFVVRSIKDTSGGGGMLGGLMSGMDNVLPIILPCADITEAAAQAPETEEVLEEAPAAPEATEAAPEDMPAAPAPGQEEAPPAATMPGADPASGDAVPVPEAPAETETAPVALAQ